ncbi:unnamed protein product [Caenorhabditis brenneri]
MSFPLLRLPLLASINVIKNIDVEDLINIIRTSRRMKNLVKSSRIYIHLNVISNYYIEFKKLSDPWKTDRVELSVEPSSTEIMTPFEPFVRQKSWIRNEENLEGYRRIMDDFLDIFRVKSADFDMRSTHSNFSIQYLDYALSRGLKFKEVQFFLHGEDDADSSRKVLEAGAHATELHVVSYTENPVFDAFRGYSMDNFELTIHRKRGSFTIDHLFALANCSNVIIRYTYLSDHDLNRFMKFWISGAGNLKSLVIVIEWTEDRLKINAQDVMDGIPSTEIKQGENFEIERFDGTKALIWCQGVMFILGDIDPDSVLY